MVLLICINCQNKQDYDIIKMRQTKRKCDHMKKINAAFCSYPDYSGNAKALYDYMQKKYKNINCMWVVKNHDIYEKLRDDGINVVIEKTDEMKEQMKITDVIFTTHANLTEYKEQNSHTLYVELWHGVSPKCIGYLINDISENDQEWLKKATKKIDYFIVPSKFWVPIFSARFNTLAKRVLPLGFPLFDNILKSNGTENLEKVLNINVTKYKKIIYYMPTVKAGNSRVEKIQVNQNNVFNIQAYEEEELIDYLSKNNYLLCVKYHPSEKLKFNMIDSENIKYINEDNLKKHKLDTYAILNAADILITDYSSLGLLYLILERPVIYLANDLKEFNDTRGILFGNFKFWTENKIAIDLESLIEKIESNIDSFDIDKIKTKKDLLFGNLSDGGCKEICEFFFTNDGLKEENIEYNYCLNSYLEEKNAKLEVENQELKEEIKQITSSKGYKIVENIKKIINKIRKKI